jgi:hypothetical protein
MKGTQRIEIAGSRSRLRTGAERSLSRRSPGDVVWRHRGAGKKTFKVHLDGYNFMPFFRGDEKQGPRDVIYSPICDFFPKSWKAFSLTPKPDIDSNYEYTPQARALLNSRPSPFSKRRATSRYAITA